MSVEPRIARCLTAAALMFALATSPFAASPPASPAPQLVELDEVVVTAMQSLPLETYVAYPEFDSVAISPDGTRLAMSWTEGSYARLLTVSEFPSMKRLHSQQLQTHMGATDLQWAGNRFLLAQPDYPRRGYLRVRDPIGSVFLVDVERHGMQTINTEPLVQAMAGDPLREHRLEREARERNPAGAAAAVAGRRSDRESLGPVRVVKARIGSADKSLFQTIWGANRAGSNNDGYGAFELDLPQFRQSRVATLPLNDGQFVTGPDSRIALATGISEQNEEVVYYLPPEGRAAGKDWQLRVSSRRGERGLRPIVWSGNGEEYYALDGRGPTRAVVIWNAVDNTQRVLHRNPGMDIDHFALDPAGTPWVFSSAGVLPVHWYPDAAHPLAQLHQRLVQRLPGEQVDIVNASDDLSIAVARASSGRRPPVFLVMDVKSGESLTGMHSYTRLRATRLAVVEPIEVRASDGLVIQGSLTTPTDIAGNPRRGLPLLVIARAGPSGQPGSSGYEFERQLFASRGFAVLQVYPRGSRGRGGAFERAGDGQWGSAVQDDYIAAVKWAIRDGVAAAGRICFFGEGYGAFSALTAAAREPELFQCVIGISGIYDLPAMFGGGKEAVPPALQQVLGSDMQDLQARSPVSHAAAIKARVWLIDQPSDDEVPADQMVRMRKALADAGNRPRAESIGQGQGGYFLTEARAAVYERLVQFVQQNIGN